MEIPVASMSAECRKSDETLAVRAQCRKLRENEVNLVMLSWACRAGTSQARAQKILDGRIKIAAVCCPPSVELMQSILTLSLVSSQPVPSNDRVRSARQRAAWKRLALESPQILTRAFPSSRAGLRYHPLKRGNCGQSVRLDQAAIHWCSTKTECCPKRHHARKG
jgi:hypothetical protein